MTKNTTVNIRQHGSAVYVGMVVVFVYRNTLLLQSMGSDMSDIYLSGNLLYLTEDWGMKSAAYYCIDTFYLTSDLSVNL